MNPADLPNLPRRVYTGGKKAIVAFRLPKELIENLKLLADENGWNLTDIAQTLFDNYVQVEFAKKEKKTKGSK